MTDTPSTSRIDETIHIPFLMIGIMALIGSGAASDHGLPNTGTALGIIGVFMFTCNVAIFYRMIRYGR